jgi:hypothetical protein
MSTTFRRVRPHLVGKDDRRVRSGYELATLTWDSPASLKALSERNYVLDGSPDGKLSEAQRFALG